MEYSKILEIITITAPVFTLAGVGKLLAHFKIITSSNKKPLSWITYYLALPALIFVSFLEKEPFSISITALFTMSILPIVFSVLFVLFFLHFTKHKQESEKRAATIYLSFWGNNGYMGIPIAVSAIGIAHGLPLAAIINGLSVPFYITISMILMYKAKEHSEDREKIKKEFLHHTLFNPVILAMIFGAIISTFKPHLPSTFISNVGVISFYNVSIKLLTQLGDMGLPLALLLVGSNLNLKEIQSDKFLLSISVIGKLIIAPATVFLLAYRLFPNLSKESFQILILMNAVPGAVASYIISEKFQCAEEFVSSSLVLTTLFSIFTIPLWLHIIL